MSNQDMKFRGGATLNMPLKPDETIRITAFDNANVSGTLTFRRYGNVAFVSGRLTVSGTVDGSILSAGKISSSLKPDNDNTIWPVSLDFGIKFMGLSSMGTLSLYNISSNGICLVNGSYQIATN